ncbi:TlpA disulfide reductase family protein [Bacillus sp. CGMCC 1.16541]|uniref:peroxiredoxin family protein n=1 Tax=Bacillus sp. CGMCC 1.16541 TaxID=2185143 RepID=UPI000D733B06|nr:TlpA disulfide reductase family protein [Bacillus sp. CGMCC 1.16541]
MKWNVSLLMLIVAVIGFFLYKEYGEPKVTLNEKKKEEQQPFTTTSVQPGMGLLEGQRPPNIELTTLDGGSFRLNDYRGKKVILNFWATWCPPCKAEMPDMQKLYEKYGKENVEIVAVNLTQAEKNKEDIQRFKEEYGLTFIIPLDETGTIANQYNVYSIPTSYILDEEGLIQQQIIGPMTYEWMEEQIQSKQ